MAAPTVAEVRAYFGGLSNLTDAQVTTYINDAVEQVKQDGMTDANHTSYNLLVRLRIGMALASNGAITVAAGDVVKEKVADVEIQYAQGSGSGAGQSQTLSYQQQYWQLLRNVLGLLSRLGS